MKSVLAITSLAAIAAAIPDHLQSVPSVTCTDPPTKTVTVMAGDCGSGSGSGSAPVITGAPGSGSGSGVSTVTVTEVQTVISISIEINEGTTSTVYSTVGASTTTAGSGSGASSSGSVATSTASGSGAQKTHTIDVGAFPDAAAPGGKVFQFRPNNITAAEGDVVEFNMLAANHSVTQSSFSKPCVHSGDFDLGFLPNPNNVSDSIVKPFTVDVTTPLWFYCRQDDPISHCGTGMVFGINPTSNTQMEQFIAQAIAQNGTGTATSTTSGSQQRTTTRTVNHSPSHAATHTPGAAAAAARRRYRA